MSKEIIKAILRENIFDKIKEASPTPPTEGGETKTGSGKDNKKYIDDYHEVQRKLDGTMLKASQVMQAAGLGQSDDATARSLFAKKLKQEKNDEGGTYRFDEKELASIIKVINNPSSYLNTTKLKKNN